VPDPSMMGFSVRARSLDFIGFRFCSCIYECFDSVLFYRVYHGYALFSWCHGAKICAANLMAPRSDKNGRDHPTNEQGW
jgi:hypothetical protein